MKFVIKKERTYWWPVTVHVPSEEKSGEFVEETFQAKFKSFGRDRLRQYDQDVAVADNQEIRDCVADGFIQEALIDWKEVEDEDGEPVKYTEEALQLFLSVDWYRTGLFIAFLGSVRGEAARVKN